MCPHGPRAAAELVAAVREIQRPSAPTWGLRESVLSRSSAVVTVDVARPVVGWAAVRLRRSAHRRVTLVPLPDEVATESGAVRYAVHREPEAAVRSDIARYVRAPYATGLAVVEASGRWDWDRTRGGDWAEDIEVTGLLVSPAWSSFVVNLDAPWVRVVLHDPVALLDDDRDEAGQ